MLEEPNLISVALATRWALSKAINNFIFRGEAICPDKLLNGWVHNACSFINVSVCNKSIIPAPKVYNPTSLVANDKILNFMDAVFSAKDEKSSYSIYMMKTNSPTAADILFGSRLSSSKEAKAQVILFILKDSR